MKIFKTSKLQQGMIFHVQDRDRGFVFVGRVRFYELDFIQFDVLPMYEAPSCKTRGIYTLNIGSSFSLHGVKWDDKRNGYVYDESSITSEYLVIDDDKNNDNVKEAKDMNLDFWKDCVIKDDAWVVNDQIKVGDTIYQIKTDAIDIKGHMTIGSTSYGMLSVEFDYGDKDTDSIQIKITPDMRVFKPDSPDNPGILVQQQECKFNPELRVGKLYWVTDSNKNIPYMVHVKSITDNAIEVHIISTVKEHNNTSSLTVTGKTFGIAELLEYKFKEVNNGGYQ